MKNYINEQRNNEPKTGVYFKDFINQTVQKKQRRFNQKYQRPYKTLIYHLDNFSNKFQAEIFTNSVNEEFLDDFIVYLENNELKQTYIKSLLGLIKNMIKKAGNYGYAIDQSYDDVEVKDEDPFSIYLSMNEITRIYYYKGLTKKQEQIKDLFIVGCLTGLRYSDYSTLTKLDFNDNFIQKTTQKTNRKVIIPVHDYVKEIYEKYDGEISKGLCIQHFNRYIKSICKKIGLTKDITYTYTRGGKNTTETKQKWELVSSHTARRSAATNMYLTSRMKTYEIMQITGHTTEKSFFRYIRVSSKNIANQIANDNFFKI